MTAGGAASAAIATVISKARLQTVSLGIFNLFRVTIGTFVFFIAAVKLFGFEHFSDVASPFLWQWMLVYSAVIIVGGQLAWFLGLRSATAADVSLVSSFSPIAGILSTYAILGDVPTIYQYIGGAVIVVGIVLNQIGTTQLAQAIPPKPASACALDEVGYKGI
jgi:drug/metabolite transporter (DMT)-like permease